MANVNLKTDFKDGEFLYADQLKNNFEAIQAALDTMNAIVWQDNADKVVTFRGTTEELMNRPIIDGQILYDTTTGESYIDYLGKRISTGSGNAIHIGDTEPTNPSTQIWINDNELSAVGSEVVNSLDGNEERMAPSVATVNKALGKIIESGSNENGAWIKYDTGNMVCMHTLQGSTLGYIDVTYAQPFKGIPHVIPGALVIGENYFAIANAKSVLSGSCKMSVGRVGINDTFTEYSTDYISYIAIGRWK